MAVPEAEIADQLAEVVEAAPGRLGVAVVADDGWRWARAAERVGRSASTIKVPVLLAALRRVERGEIDLSDEVCLPAPDRRVGGAGALALLPSVRALPLLEALRLMIALSDNDATNAVIDRLGLLDGGEVDRLLGEVPTRSTHLRRHLMDLDAAARGVENETCPADLADLLVALREGRLLGPAATQVALDLLRAQQWTDGLPAYLPADVSVASKTGDQRGLRADLALFEKGDRWVAVAAVADGLLEEPRPGDGPADRVGDRAPGSAHGHTVSRPSAVDRGTSVLPVFATIGELAARLLDR